MDKVIVENGQTDNRPTPDDFINFLPWACNQLQLDCTIHIIKVFQNEHISSGSADRSKKGRTKPTQSRYDVNSIQDKEVKSASGLPALLLNQNTVKVVATYDTSDNLVEIKFDKNKQVPRQVLKIIGLIIQFQPHVTRITINAGVNVYTTYEISKFLNNSNITEICLDDTFLKEANYDVLLEGENAIRYLSLSRCRIDDKVVDNIAKNLTLPLPASKSLTAIVLSSNRITDNGVKCLALALRSNRKLSYISLADNDLTDDAVNLILDSLTEFPLNCDEVISARQRYVHYLKVKNLLTSQMVQELRAGEFDRKPSKRKSMRPVTATSSGRKGKLEKESSMKSLVDTKSIVNMEHMLYNKAVNMVEERLGEFNDPYNSDNVTVKDGIVHCKGNNTLCYLNLAYNNLSYMSLKKLLSALIYQKVLDRRPRGLVNVLIEGNDLPISCSEMSQIDDILETGLTVHNRRPSGTKKRTPIKGTPR